MAKISLRQRVFDTLTVLGLAAVTAGLIALPGQMVEAARSGVELSFNVLIPSLFPFFVISSLTLELGLADRLGRLASPLMGPLFHVGGECAPALILGSIGGYPVGAKTIIALYSSGRCSREEAERMLAFCNNSGPAFILGVVGAGIFSSSAVGLTLYAVHLVSSLIVGLLFRGRRTVGTSSGGSGSAHEAAALPAAFVRAVSSSFQSCLGICGFVIFFTVLLRLLSLSGALEWLAGALGAVFGFLGMDSGWAARLLTGLLELTSGVWSLREVSGSLTASMTMAAFMLGWAGLSVHCQVLSFLGSTGLSARPYILGKLLHGLISAALTAALMAVVSGRSAAGVYLAEQVTDISGVDFASALRASAALSAGVLFIFLISAVISVKTGGKKER